MALAKYEVVGPIPIRDAVTRESVPQGGVVQLDDEPVPRKTGKPLAATDIAALIAAGCIKPFVEVKAEKAPKVS